MISLQINPGIFNKKIEIIKITETKDNDGFPIKSEIVILNAWAHVTNVSGTEIMRANSDFSEVKTRFLIRTPKSEITKDMVIRFAGKTYNIIYINDYSYDKKYTEIITELVVK